MPNHPDVMEKLVSLAKRRGFIFQSSEIYGGTGSVWDYGPLGVELKTNARLGRDFTLADLRQQVAMGKTLFGNPAHLRKTSKGIQQIQQRRVGSAKLTLEIVGRSTKQLGNALRVLMWSGSSDDKPHAIFPAPAGAPGHLLDLGRG